MSLNEAFEDLLRNLREVESDLESKAQWAIGECVPSGQQHSLQDRYEREVTDILGLIHEAEVSAAEGCKATEDVLDLSAARRALIRCLQMANSAADLLSRLYSIQSQPELQTFIAEHRDDSWGKWAAGVQDAISRCPNLFDELPSLSLRCWSELSAISTGIWPPRIHKSQTIAAQKTQT
jgi:hypothetical protein